MHLQMSNRGDWVCCGVYVGNNKRTFTFVFDPIVLFDVEEAFMLVSSEMTFQSKVHSHYGYIMSLKESNQCLF